MTSGGQRDDEGRQLSATARRPPRWASSAGDQIVAINGVPVTGATIPDKITGSNGKPLTVVVLRDGDAAYARAARRREGRGRLPARVRPRGARACPRRRRRARRPG